MTVIDDYFVEIWFPIEKDKDGYPQSKHWEQLLARPMLEADTCFQIESVPFYLRNISRGDIVQARTTENREIDEGEVFEFADLIKRGGHNTYRLLLQKKRPDDPEFTKNELLKKGLVVEVEYDELFAIDVPPSVNQKAIDQYLLKENSAGRWSLQDGYLHNIATASVQDDSSD